MSAQALSALTNRTRIDLKRSSVDAVACHGPFSPSKKPKALDPELAKASDLLDVSKHGDPSDRMDVGDETEPAEYDRRSVQSTAQVLYDHVLHFIGSRWEVNGHTVSLGQDNGRIRVRVVDCNDKLQSPSLVIGQDDDLDDTRLLHTHLPTPHKGYFHLLESFPGLQAGQRALAIWSDYELEDLVRTHQQLDSQHLMQASALGAWWVVSCSLDEAYTLMDHCARCFSGNPSVSHAGPQLRELEGPALHKRLSQLFWPRAYARARMHETLVCMTEEDARRLDRMDG